MQKKIIVRFCIVHYEPIYTGAGLSLAKLINSLDKNKISVEVLTAHREGLLRVEKKNNYKIIRIGRGIFNSDGYLSKLGKLYFSFSSAWYNLLNPNFSILKFIGIGHIFLPSIIVAKILNRPIVNKFTATGDDGPKKLSITFLGRFIIKLLNKNAAHWVISKEIYYQCKQYTNWENENLFLITNPVKVNYPTYEILKKNRVFKRDNLKTFLFVGMLNRRKGVDILLKIWETNKINAKLVLCGPRGFDDKINRRLDNLINDNIIEMGMVDHRNLDEYYLSSDYLIFPTRMEGLPNVVLESMSFGLPIIANNLDGVTNYLLGDKNERGLLISGNKISLWVSTIIELINTDNKLEREAKLAFEWVREHSSYSAVGRDSYLMYQYLLPKFNE